MPPLCVCLSDVVRTLMPSANAKIDSRRSWGLHAVLWERGKNQPYCVHLHTGTPISKANVLLDEHLACACVCRGRPAAMAKAVDLWGPYSFGQTLRRRCGCISLASC